MFETVAAKAPLLIVDDLQWADTTSLAVLAVVARRAPRIALLVAYRSTEAPPGGPAASFLADVADTAGGAPGISPRPPPAAAVPPRGRGGRLPAGEPPGDQGSAPAVGR